MTWVIVGLGNPGSEYDETRHNTGRMALESIVAGGTFPALKHSAAHRAYASSGKIGTHTVAFVAPDTFMNKSGSAVGTYVKSARSAERMIVMYDDLDLPLGTLKISFDRGSGGHKGLESVMRAVKTKRFARIRIGISRASARGKIKKPRGEKEVTDFILGKFKPAEKDALKRVFARVSDAVRAIVEDGIYAAMNQWN